MMNKLGGLGGLGGMDPMSRMMLGASLMNAGGPSLTPTSGFEGIPQTMALLQQQQMRRKEQEEEKRMREAQMSAVSKLGIDPNLPGTLQAAQFQAMQPQTPEVPKAPTVKQFFDHETGQPYSAQWVNGQWERVGGVKAPSGMSIRTNPDGTMELIQGPNAGQRLTEMQGKDVGFFTRGIDANRQLEGLENNLTSWTQQNADQIPLGLGNYARTPEFRQAKQAADSFLTAILRKDTGAAITAQEFDIYGPMFLPVPGDDQKTIEQKRRAREVALMAIKSGLGTAEAIAEANKAALGIGGQGNPSGQQKPISEMSDEELEAIANGG